MVGRAPMNLARQRDIVADHAYVPVPTDLTHRQPHLEGSEPARVLRPPLVEIRGRVFGVAVELVVRRMKAVGVAERVWVAYESAACLEGCVQPLVRIHGDR